MSIPLKDKALYSRLQRQSSFDGNHSPLTSASQFSSRAASPSPLPPDDHFAYSTSLRRHEPDTSIIDFGASASHFPPAIAGRFTAYSLPTGPTAPPHHHANGHAEHYASTSSTAAQAAHHPFAHTTTPVTPSNHYATHSVAQTLSALATSSTTGLSSDAVPAIRELAGANEFQVGAKDPLWKQFLEHFKEPLILLLLASAAVSAFVGNYDDALSIIAAVAIVVTVGFVQERRSEKSLEALNKLVPHYCNIIRDGRKSTLLANVLVPGDLVTFRTGDRVPADVRLTQAHGLEIDESTLTGETKPALKQTEPIPNDGHGQGGLPISDRSNIAFMGTLVRSGRGEGIVVGTGIQSEFGVVFTMMQEIDDRKTPLQMKMDDLAKRLSALSFGIIGIICLIGVYQNRSWLDMFTIGGESRSSASASRASETDKRLAIMTVSLAVAAIPEGLPIVVTVTLALGVLRMAKRNAIVKKLPSVETLGSVSVICSDKTGTLTTNIMTVTQAYTVDHGVFDVHAAPPILSYDDSRSRLFLVGSLCNHSHRDRHGKYVGQATEVAMMNVLAGVGLSDQRKASVFVKRSEVPFDSNVKTQSCTGVFSNQPADRDVTYLCGAVEAVLQKCRFYLREDHSTAALEQGVVKLIQSKAVELASSGLRVVGMASGPDPEALVFAGFQAMMDPPRKGVDSAIAQLSNGGVQVVMITGDSVETATSIARQLGIRTNPGTSGCLTGKELDLMSQRQLTGRIGGVSVFARTTPKHKMAIIEAFQARGAVVAMTGDGVNDAPALKMADIGVSMGRGGTDVAKEAADVILVDDNFATLLPAVEEGKSIFVNIQNFLVFQLSTAVAALSLITISTALGLPNPLNAMQILYINVLMDGPPAQSLGVDPVQRDVMQRPPRPKTAPILSRRLLGRVGFSAVVIILGVLFILARELSDGSTSARDQSMTFTSFVFLDLVSALQNRGLNVSLLGAQANKMLLTTISISFIAQLSLVYMPFLQSVFHTASLSPRDLSLLLFLAACSFSLHEARRRWERKSDMDEMWLEAQTV
ncbi:High affinity Ca2+/Mn2+ P-type ATPase-like protein [Microbotryomycetes sp. JL201]|nr:High affinity Ca2+/Mn2+ P-type ATPase-like protein [Microbotryomycetes sp. JL201]